VYTSIWVELLGLGGGLFSTRNGAASWEAVANPCLPEAALTTHPLDAERVYCYGLSRSSHLQYYKTENGGQAWTSLPAVPGIESAYDTLAVAPSSTSTLYRYDWSSGAIAVSRDGGASFSVPIGEQETIYVLAVDALNDNTLYLSTSHGLQKSMDAGRSRLSMSVPPAGQGVLVLDPTRSGVLYNLNVVSGELDVSLDGGNTWTVAESSGLPNVDLSGAWVGPNRDLYALGVNFLLYRIEL
jgi:hypothetical protein